MIIVNFSTVHYANAQRRLRDSLRSTGYEIITFSDYAQINSPTHQESPYEFKIHAIEAASKIDPVVLWCDSSMYRVGDLKLIENKIINDGFFGEEAGHYAGRWTNQHTRQFFNVTETEMNQGEGGITLFSAGLLGLNFENIESRNFFYQWYESAKAGCFRGDWSDHRHDMTCASIIATRLGFKYTSGGSHMAYIGPGYSQPEPNVVFYCQGM